MLLNHRYEVTSGFKNLFRSFQKKKGPQAPAEYQDVHNTLMAKYPEGKHTSPPKLVILIRRLIFDNSA